MRTTVIILIFTVLNLPAAKCQVKENSDARILFRGIVADAETLAPVSDAQIMINGEFSALSGRDGSFTFYVNRHDTVTFRNLGYRPSVMPVSDTLSGQEFVAGVFMNSDTVTIGEVIIVPGYRNLRSDLLSPRTTESAEMSNARYNMAISAYQGRNSQNVLGDPQDNYAALSQRQKTDAFEKGGIPSNNMVTFNPLILLPAAYLLMHGFPEAPAPMNPQLSEKESEQVMKLYLERQKARK